MKIGLVAAVVLLAFTAGVYVVVTRELRESMVHSVETEVSRAQRMHGDVARLESMEFANLVSGLSRRPAVVGVFDKGDETGRRQAAFEQCEKLNSFLQTGGARKADIVAILDSAGKVVARDRRKNSPASRSSTNVASSLRASHPRPRRSSITSWKRPALSSGSK